MSTPTISVKQAVQKAKTALSELYEDDPPKSLALEEVELITEKDKSLWSVTLGFYRERSLTSNAMIDVMLVNRKQVENRVYKTLLIDAETGDFVRMDMRQTQ